MKPFAIAVASMLLATAVHAEIYQWKDDKGRTIISDKPPLGKVTQQQQVETSAPPASAASQKSSADRDLEFRKRRQESDDKAGETKRKAEEQAAKQENCDRARRHLQVLESGERIAMRDDTGERYFMDETQREQELVKTREVIQASCSK